MTDEEENQLSSPLGAALTKGAVAAAGAAVGVAHPDVAIEMAGLVAVGAELLPSFVMDRVKPFRRRQLAKVVAAGAASEGVSPEVLIGKARETDSRTLLTTDMLEAAARTAYEEKLAALGRAWARGVVTDDDGELAVEHQFVRTISRLEVPHVQVLGVVAQTPSLRPQGMPLPNGWTPNAVGRELPQYGAMSGQLLAVLASEGLVVDASTDNALSEGTQYRITSAGTDVLRRIAEAAATVEGESPDGAPE